MRNSDNIKDMNLKNDEKRDIKGKFEEEKSSSSIIRSIITDIDYPEQASWSAWSNWQNGPN